MDARNGLFFPSLRYEERVELLFFEDRTPQIQTSRADAALVRVVISPFNLPIFLGGGDDERDHVRLGRPWA